MNKTLKLVLATCSLTASLVLAGCGLGTTTSQAIAGNGGAASGSGMTGKVKGGQQPVAGSTLHLYAASTSGYGAAAYDMQPKDGGGNTPTTDANGNFSVASFTCSSPCSGSSLVYVVLAGGDAGAGSNSQSAWLMALGPKSALGTLPFLQVNETTTLATAYALAPFFGADYAHLGTSSSNVQGLQNAFALVNSLVNIATGWGSGTGLPPGATVTTDSLYALADVIAACVNSAGGTSAGTNCGNLLNCTTGGSCSCTSGSCTTSGTPPADTAMAAVAMAKNTSQNVSQLYGLVPGQLVFPTGLSGTPNDWSMAIKYTDSSLNNAAGSAVDASGDLWVANTGSGKVTELAMGSGAVGSGSYTTGSLSSYTLSGPALNPNALAIDSSGTYVWVVAGTGTGSTSSPTSATAALYKLQVSNGSQTAECSHDELNNPTAVTIDSQGNIWVTNSGSSSITEFSSSCAFVANYTGAGISGGIAIAAGAH